MVDVLYNLAEGTMVFAYVFVKCAEGYALQVIESFKNNFHHLYFSFERDVVEMNMVDSGSYCGETGYSIIGKIRGSDPKQVRQFAYDMRSSCPSSLKVSLQVHMVIQPILDEKDNRKRTRKQGGK